MGKFNKNASPKRKKAMFLELVTKPIGSARRKAIGTIMKRKNMSMEEATKFQATQILGMESEGGRMVRKINESSKRNVISKDHVEIPEPIEGPRFTRIAPKRSSGGGGGSTINVVTVTGNRTLTSSNQVIFCNATSGNITINLPLAGSVSGIFYHIKKTDSSSNTVIVDAGSQTIDDGTTATLATQYESIKIVSDGSNYQIV